MLTGPESRLNVTAQQNCLAIFIRHDIVPCHDITFLNGIFQGHIMRQPQRQVSARHRHAGRAQTASDRLAAFAVENFTGNEVTLGDRDHISIEHFCRPRGLAAQPHRGNRDC